MRVLIIGAGPAGLSLGHALRRERSLGCDVTVLERRKREEPLGWGITLHPATMPAFGDQAVGSFVDITPFEVKLDGRTVRKVGFLNHGISRLAFRDILLERSVAEGVRVEFGVDGRAELLGATRYDLVVGCDGAMSAVRSERLADFQPSIEYGRNRFIWLGTGGARAGMRVNVRRVGEQIVTATTYPYSLAMSTVVVECGEATWTTLGFDTMPVEESVAVLSSFFREDLDGLGLLHAPGARWRSFPCVTNGRWAAGNITLLGDALHTTHFSMGVGTRLALDDARALVDSLKECGGDVVGALRTFEHRHRPMIEKAQAIAQKGMRWSEDLHAPENAAHVAARLGGGESEASEGAARRGDPPFET